MKVRFYLLVTKRTDFVYYFDLFNIFCCKKSVSCSLTCHITNESHPFILFWMLIGSNDELFFQIRHRVRPPWVRQIVRGTQLLSIKKPLRSYRSLLPVSRPVLSRCVSLEVSRLFPWGIQKLIQDKSCKSTSLIGSDPFLDGFSSSSLSRTLYVSRPL